MKNTRQLWAAFIVLSGFLVALIGGVLAWLGGTPVALAIICGAAGWAGFIAIALAIANFLTRANE